MESDDELVKSTVSYRIKCLTIQERFVSGLPPLLLKEIRQALDLHSEAVKQPHLAAKKELLGDLDKAHSRVSEHWCKVNKDYYASSALISDIGLHQLFLTRFLLDDYAPTWFPRGPKGTASEVHDWACRMAGLINACGVDGGDSDDKNWEYQRSVVSPLEEMGLNRAHVEDKIRALAAAQPGHSCNFVQRIIRQHDWQTLAEVLLNDRELVIDLFEPPPVLKGLFDKPTRTAILKSIDHLTSKYFTELSGPTRYTLSIHAVGAEAKHSILSSIDQSITLGRGKDEGGRSMSEVFADGFKFLGAGMKLGLRSHTVSSRLSRDEKAPLVDSKEKQ